jgi:hypothetical protein
MHISPVSTETQVKQALKNPLFTDIFLFSKISH